MENLWLIRWCYEVVFVLFFVCIFVLYIGIFFKWINDGNLWVYVWLNKVKFGGCGFFVLIRKLWFLKLIWFFRLIFR